MADEQRTPFWYPRPSFDLCPGSSCSVDPLWSCPGTTTSLLVDLHWKHSYFDYDISPALFAASRTSCSHFGFAPTQDIFTLLPAVIDLPTAVGGDHRLSSEGHRLTSSFAPSGRHLADSVVGGNFTCFPSEYLRSSYSSVGLSAAAVGVFGASPSQLGSGHSPPSVGVAPFVIDEPLRRLERFPALSSRSEDLSILAGIRPRGAINVKTSMVFADAFFISRSRSCFCRSLCGLSSSTSISRT